MRTFFFVVQIFDYCHRFKRKREKLSSWQRAPARGNQHKTQKTLVGKWKVGGRNAFRDKNRFHCGGMIHDSLI